MPATIRRFLVAAPLTVLFSAACWAQTTAFEGDVKGEDGKGVKDAIVHIERKDIKGSYKVKTDKKGHYYYGGLPIGTYTISVEVDGKSRDSVDNVKSKLGDPTPVSFDLAAAAARAGEAGGAAGAAPGKEVERGMSAAQKAEYEKKLQEQRKRWLRTRS